MVKRRVWMGMALIVCAAAVGPALATSVVPMELTTLADHAGQVIVGDVLSVRSYWAENPRRIETEVIFSQTEYLKGRQADSSVTFRLLVPGGTVGTLTMRVADAPTFAVGEKWALFLLPTYKTFPVVGISQGAFRITRDADGVERVYDAARQAVTGVDSDGFVRATTLQAAEPAEHLRAAEGVRLNTQATPQPTASAMTYAEFVQVVQPVLAKSRAHALAGPAGQPALVRPSAVPLQGKAERGEQAVERRGEPSPRRLPATARRVAP